MKNYCGEFEEILLMMVIILEEEAYGNKIVQEIQDQLNRSVNLSAVHITLYRLEDKGFVKSYYGGATNTRGGRRKRIFQITEAGKNLVYEIQEQRQKLWKLMPGFNFNA
ncbi:MAG: PadR family transcriptional regulator [Thalassobius sp.]|nr:PadR family transcriptional regulator [Thalassovita sp.]